MATTTRPLIDLAALRRHWAADATAVYNPLDLSEGIRVYHRQRLVLTVPIPDQLQRDLVTFEAATPGIMFNGGVWLPAAPEVNPEPGVPDWLT